MSLLVLPYITVYFLFGGASHPIAYTQLGHLMLMKCYESLSDSCDAHPSSQHIPMISNIYIYISFLSIKLILNPQRSPFWIS